MYLKQITYEKFRFPPLYYFSLHLKQQNFATIKYPPLFFQLSLKFTFEKFFLTTIRENVERRSQRWIGERRNRECLPSFFKIIFKNSR